MIKYFEVQQTTHKGETLFFIEKHTESGCYSIPLDESNIDYREYLAWIAEGNEPEVWKGKE